MAVSQYFAIELKRFMKTPNTSTSPPTNIILLQEFQFLNFRFLLTGNGWLAGFYNITEV